MQAKNVEYGLGRKRYRYTALDHCKLAKQDGLQAAQPSDARQSLTDLWQTLLYSLEIIVAIYHRVSNYGSWLPKAYNRYRHASTQSQKSYPAAARLSPHLRPQAPLRNREGSYRGKGASGTHHHEPRFAYLQMPHSRMRRLAPYPQRRNQKPRVKEVPLNALFCTFFKPKKHIRASLYPCYRMYLIPVIRAY